MAKVSDTVTQMKLSVERLRWVLVVAAALLLMVLAGTIGYGRYRAAKLWHDIQKRAGVTVERETDGFTYSQSVQGRTLFSMHASKAVQHTDGKWTLHDVVITMYGREQGRADRIFGNTFEYDEKSGVARAVGEVNMDLQAPASAALQSRASKDLTGEVPDDAAAKSIRVRTSGLVFLRKLGIAATEEPVEFRYGGLVCTSRGAEFDSDGSVLHLLADVDLRGDLHGRAMELKGAKADFDRAGSVASIVSPVLLSQGRMASAGTAVVRFNSDGSAKTLEAAGGVLATQGTQQIRAPQLSVDFGDSNQPRLARLRGGVDLVDSNTLRPMQANAQELTAAFNAQGEVEHLQAAGSVHLLERVQQVGTASGHAQLPLERELSAEKVEAQLGPGTRKGSRVVQTMHASGNAIVRGQSLRPVARQQPELLQTAIAGDNLVAGFTTLAQATELRTVHGQGHMTLRQTSALGADQSTSADTLQAEFAPSAVGHHDMQLASVKEEGHVRVRSLAEAKASVPGHPAKAPAPVMANAEHAVYDGIRETVVLNGHAQLAEEATQLSADTVTLEQRSGDATASGAVLASLGSATEESNSAAKPVTHISADHATLVHATQVATFTAGTRPARLWQNASQVEAQTLVFNGMAKTLDAEPRAGGEVHAVFAGQSVETGSVRPATTGHAAPAAVQVSAHSMMYSDATRQATFVGDVRVVGATGVVQGAKAIAQMSAAPPKTPATAHPVAGADEIMGGSLETVTISGGVRLAQPGRRGTGEQLVYTAADGNFVLTGTPATPPRVVSDEQGMVTGTALLFRAGDSTIVVKSAGVKPGEKPQRAHTEVHVKQ